MKESLEVLKTHNQFSLENLPNVPIWIEAAKKVSEENARVNDIFLGDSKPSTSKNSSDNQQFNWQENSKEEKSTRKKKTARLAS